MSSLARGRRTMPHTADVIIEAWGSDAATCAEEAAAGLLGVCISGAPGETTDGPDLYVAEGPYREMVESILEHLVYLFDTSDLVPVGVVVRPRRDGDLEVRTRVAAVDTVQLTGAVPKGIVLQSVQASRTGHRCRFIVDV